MTQIIENAMNVKASFMGLMAEHKDLLETQLSALGREIRVTTVIGICTAPLMTVGLFFLLSSLALAWSGISIAPPNNPSLSFTTFVIGGVVFLLSLLLSILSAIRVKKIKQYVLQIKADIAADFAVLSGGR